MDGCLVPFFVDLSSARTTITHEPLSVRIPPTGKYSFGRGGWQRARAGLRMKDSSELGRGNPFCYRWCESESWLLLFGVISARESWGIDLGTRLCRGAANPDALINTVPDKATRLFKNLYLDYLREFPCTVFVPSVPFGVCLHVPYRNWCASRWESLPNSHTNH